MNPIVAIGSSRAPAVTPDKMEQPIAKILWRDRRIIGMAVGALFFLATIYVLIVKPTYTSTAEVYMPPARAGVIADSQDEVERSDNYLYTQCQLMTSTPILALALTQDGVNDLKSLQGVGDPIAFLKKRLNADVGKNNDLIYVSMDDHDPVDAANIVNAVCRAFVAYQTRTQHSTSAEMLDILQKEEGRDQALIASKDAELAQLRAQYGDVSYDNNQSNPIVQQEAALSNALTAARLDAVSAKTAYDEGLKMIESDPAKLKEVEEPDDAGDLVAAAGTQLDLVKEEMFKLQESLKDMERMYLPDHPIVLKTRARLNQLTVTYVRAERERWLSAKANEDALQVSFDQQHKLVLDEATRTADMDRVKQDRARVDADLDKVEGRMSEVTVNQDAGGLNISIAEPAQPSLTPTHPNKTRTYVAALVAGLLLGSGISLAKEKLPLAGRHGNRLSAELGVPVLGVLPNMEGVGVAAARALQAHLDPVGRVAESARHIAMALSHAGLDEESGRTLLVASANPLDGRTTLATNLAIAMAQSGLRVLLVDANNRSPRLHHILKVDNTYGLYDVLAGQVGDQPAINSTQVDGLDLLPCGSPPANAVERLNSEALVDVLGELSDRYDRVIVDSPALGRGVEGRILAANCAAVILVAPARATARRQMEQGLRLLRSVGANVLGVVINEPGPIDPLTVVGADGQTARHALSSGGARALQPVAYVAGAEA